MPNPDFITHQNSRSCMKQSRFFELLMASAIMMLLAACGGASEGDEGSSGDTTGVTDTEILIGSWGPMTGPAAAWGVILKGTDAYFKMINDEGGIHGRQIKFVYKDDQYNPSVTVPAVREMVQRDEVFAIAGGIGTAPGMAVAGFLEENNVPWISPMTGATYWTHPTKENIFTSFPLYFDEATLLSKFAVEQLEAKKIGILYVNDDFGKSGLVGVEDYLSKHDRELVAALPVEITDTDLSSHVAKLKESGADAVFLWLLPRQAAITMGSSAVIGYQPAWLASLVLSDLSLMHNITKGAWEGVYFTYPVATMFNDESNAGMMKYQAAFAKYYPDERWGTFASAGFTWIEILVEGLRRAGRDLTRESFVEALNNLGAFNSPSGLSVSFSPDNHLGTRSLSIMRCISADEAELIGETATSTSDVSALIHKLEGD